MISNIDDDQGQDILTIGQLIPEYAKIESTAEFTKGYSLKY